MLQRMAVPLEKVCAGTRDVLRRWPHFRWWINIIKLFFGTTLITLLSDHVRSPTLLCKVLTPSLFSWPQPTWWRCASRAETSNAWATICKQRRHFKGSLAPAGTEELVRWCRCCSPPSVFLATERRHPRRPFWRLIRVCASIRCGALCSILTLYATIEQWNFI